MTETKWTDLDLSKLNETDLRRFCTALMPLIRSPTFEQIQQAAQVRAASKRAKQRAARGLRKLRRLAKG